MLTLLLSIYLLVLACLPCGDREECKEPAQTCLRADTRSESHDHLAEHCTPFCTCTCCAAAVCAVRTQSIPAEPAPFYEEDAYLRYRSPFYAAVSFAIWQPPRLA
jgi:hypothetical protein